MIFRVLAPVEPRTFPRIAEFLRDIVALGKPRITALVVFTAAVGAAIAPSTPRDHSYWAALLVGLAFTVAGANALNMWLERDVDALMARTASRPLPAGRLAPSVALATGVLWSACGLAILAAGVNGPATWLATAGVASYVLGYTPLKRVTPLALEVGAIPGAVSTLVGWAAATGSVDAPGVALFLILFFWQLPHFLALASFRRDDYARAGLRVFPVVYGERATRRQILLYAAILVGASTLPYWLGEARAPYLVVAILLGAGFLSGALWPQFRARNLFLYSLVYLPALLAALVLDIVRS